MSYEYRIGWRYLYAGNRDRTMMIVAAVLAAFTAGCGIVLATSHGANPIAVVGLVIGMIATAFTGLLATFSVFTSVSVMGVVFGVAALTTVLSVTTGFQQQFRDKVLGVNAHVIIMKSQNTFAEYRDVMAAAKAVDKDVLAVQPFIFAEMLVTRGKGQLSGVAIKGVDPELVRGVLDLDKHMIEGSVDDLRDTTGFVDHDAKVGPDELPPIRHADPNWLPPIIMGKELARKLKAKVGDDVTVVVPLSNVDFDTWRAKSSAPRTRKFRVVGIFYSGFDEYDRRLMYTSLRAAQELQGRGDQVHGVELKVRDINDAAAIARKIERELDNPSYQVQDWYELNHTLFTALSLQKQALVVILTLIIMVAAFNMVSALAMMVTDKTKEIAILKSMGSTSGSMAKVFMILGIAIGGVGTVVGVSIGLVTCHVVGGYGYHLDPKVYLIDRLPIDVRPVEVLLVCGITMAIAILASVLPSMAASSLRPVDGLRYD